MHKSLKIMMSTAALVLIFVSQAGAQNIARGHEKVSELSSEAAAERWDEFSKSGNLVDFCMGFTIRHLPRKDDETEFSGLMFGAQRGDKTYTRMIVSPKDSPQKKSDYILEASANGSKVWKAENGKFAKVAKEQWSQPFADALLFSPIEILMPYKNWTATYDGAGRIGQAVHFYMLKPKDGENVGEVAAARIALSREFNAPVQVEFFDADNKKLKTVSLGAVRKIDGLWMMVEAQARDEASRDRDILRFDSAKLRAILSKDIFDPSIEQSEPETPMLEKL